MDMEQLELDVIEKHLTESLSIPRILQIDKAIHEKDGNGKHFTAVRIGGRLYPITHGGNGCRTVTYAGVKFMAQNPATGTQYAKRANNGSKITWGMRKGEWILVENGEVMKGI